MSSVQAGLRKQHLEISTLLSDPAVDLRTIANRFDAFQIEGQKQCAAVRERWLCVYDALDANQKEQVRVFFKRKLEQANQADVTKQPK